MSVQFEYIEGNRQHTSTWAKFYVKGLEKWRVRADYDCGVRNCNYWQYDCDGVPAGTIFTIFDQEGRGGHKTAFVFRICRVVDGDRQELLASREFGRIAGPFEVLATGSTATKAPRLMKWWNELRPASADPLAYARLCAKYIDKRGMKVPPLSELPEFEPEKPVTLLIKRAGEVGIDSGQLVIVDEAMAGSVGTNFFSQQYADLGYPSGMMFKTGGDGDFPIYAIMDGKRVMGCFVYFDDQIDPATFVGRFTKKGG